MSTTDIILKFLSFLSDLRAMFRQVHLDVEKNHALRNVSTTVIPFKGEAADYADGGVTISVALSAELRNPADPDKKAIGMSLLLRHAHGRWIAEAEIGWTGKNIGWNSFDSREAQGATVEEIIDATPALVEWMDMRFREEVAKLSA